MKSQMDVRRTVLSTRFGCTCQMGILFLKILANWFCSLQTGAHRIRHLHTVRFFSAHYNADFVLYMLCRTIFDTEKLLEFAKLGCYLEYDLFGTEFLHYQFHPDIDMPSDNERIARYLLQCGLSSSIAIDKWILLVIVLKGITECFC